HRTARRYARAVPRWVSHRPQATAPAAGQAPAPDGAALRRPSQYTTVRTTLATKMATVHASRTLRADFRPTEWELGVSMVDGNLVTNHAKKAPVATSQPSKRALPSARSRDVSAYHATNAEVTS